MQFFITYAPFNFHFVIKEFVLHFTFMRLIICKIFKTFRGNSRASNIAFLLDIAQMSDLDFGLIQQNISIKKGFIPISRAPSFFQKLQVVIKFLYF